MIEHKWAPNLQRVDKSVRSCPSVKYADRCETFRPPFIIDEKVLWSGDHLLKYDRSLTEWPILEYDHSKEDDVANN